MKVFSSCILLALLVVASVTGDDSGAPAAGSDRARLLASKRVHNLYLVEGADIVVQYSVFNIGTAPALNVQLTDSSFRCVKGEGGGVQSVSNNWVGFLTF